MEELLRMLTDEDDWKVEMGSVYSYEEDEVVFVARVTFVSDGHSYGGVGRTPKDALSLAVNGALREEDESDYEEEEVEGAVRVLRATLDELGFDRAVALLERLNNL